MGKKLLLQYPKLTKEDAVGTIFENIKFDENRSKGLKTDLEYLTQSLIKSGVFTDIEVTQDSKNEIIFIDVVVNNFDELDKVRGSYVYNENSETGLAEYLYNLALLVLYDYKYYIKIRVFKEMRL